eukprot:223440_1
MADNLTGKLRVLQQAFITADKDGDSLLNRQEFEEFVAIGYQKSLPNGIYENLCHHFNRDPNIGIDWNTARTVFIQAQRRPSSNTSQESSSNKKQFLKQAFIQCDKDGDSTWISLPGFMSNNMQKCKDILPKKDIDVLIV